MNIKENEKEFIVELAAPGFEKKDLDIKLKDGLLTIKSEKKMENKEEKEKLLSGRIQLQFICKDI